MLRGTFTFLRYSASSVGSSLKILGLEVPTTKKAIKNAYFQLAKTHHPDLEVAQSPTQQPQSQDNSTFIAITNAYKHLSQLTEEQINAQQNSASSFEDEEYESQEGRKRMSQEQRRRQATYDFFNRRESGPRKGTRQPLYRRHPQYFIVAILLMVFTWDWVVKSLRISHTYLKLKYPKRQEKDIGKSLNFKNRFENPSAKTKQEGRLTAQ